MMLNIDRHVPCELVDTEAVELEVAGLDKHWGVVHFMVHLSH